MDSLAPLILGVVGRQGVPAGATLLDNFTGAAATALAAHTPDAGGPWVTHAGAPALNGTGGVSAGAAWLSTADLGSPNATFILLLANGSGSPRVVFRLADANNYWEVRWNPGTGILAIYEVVAGVATQRASGGYSAGSTDTINVSVNGTTVTANVNGDNPQTSYGAMATGLGATRHGCGDTTGGALLDRVTIAT